MGELKFRKRLNCTYVPPLLHGNALVQNAAPLQTSEESIPARRLAGVGGMGPVTLTCREDGEMPSELLDEVLTNFTQDLAQTTTTAAPAPAPATTAAAAPA